MQSLTLFGNSYEMSKKSHDFLTEYITRVERYVTRHQLDDDSLSDLRARVAEKLHDLKHPIKDQDVIDLVNDLGEPEDIFSDVISDRQTSSVTSHLLTDQDRQAGFLSQKKKIIFGVCLRLAEDLNMPVMYVRIIFLFLIFAGGAGIWIYLLLSLLLPGLFMSKKQSMSSEGPAVATTVVGKIWEIIKILIKWALLVFVLVVAFHLFLAGILGTIGSINLFGHWVIDGQDILSSVGPGLRIGLLVGSVSMILIALGLAAQVIGRPVFGRYSWSGLILIALFAGIAAASALPTAIQSLMYTETRTETIQTGISTGMLQVHLDDSREPHWGNYLRAPTYVEYVAGGTGVVVEIRSTLRGRNTQDLATKWQALQPYTIQSSGSTIQIDVPRTSFAPAVPLALPDRQIRIIVPKNMQIQDMPHSRSWTRYHTQLDEYTGGRYDCNDNHYTYNDRINEFICNPQSYSTTELSRAMQAFAQERLDTGGSQRLAPAGMTPIARGTYTIIPRSEWDDGRDIGRAPVSVHVVMDAQGEMYIQTGSLQ